MYSFHDPATPQGGVPLAQKPRGIVMGSIHESPGVQQYKPEVLLSAQSIDVTGQDVNCVVIVECAAHPPPNGLA